MVSLSLEDNHLRIQPFDRIGFQSMLRALLEERPSFKFFKGELEGELIYIFTRHQKYLGQRWPCLFLMGKGWERPIVMNDKAAWLECLAHLENASQ